MKAALGVRKLMKKTSSIATLHTNVFTQFFPETRTGHGVTASWRAGFGSSVYNEIMLGMRESSFTCHVFRKHTYNFIQKSAFAVFPGLKLENLYRVERVCTMIGAATVAALLPG